MRAAAAAFAWEFGPRLRFGLIAFGSYLLLLAALRFLVPGPAAPVNPARSALFAFTVSVPMTAAFLYLLAVFSHGLSGDLTARQSMYPARLFTLPMTNAALAGYPMLYGSLAMAGLYVVGNLFAARPSGALLPCIWPALFAAAFLGWTQALTWMPYGLPGLRVIVAVLALITFDAVVLLAVHYRVRETLMVALMAPQLPLAFVAAWYAVGRARRGEVPDWGAAFGRVGRVAGAVARARDRFPSAGHAQSWFEWRQHGWSLPAWLAIVLPFEVALLYIVRREPPGLTFITLIGMLLTPPFLAAFVAVTVGSFSFLATRPLTTSALVAAKLWSAFVSTLLAWLLVLASLVIGIAGCGAWPLLTARFDSLAVFVGLPRAVALVILLLAALLVSTWKQLVQGLCIGLTGREGFIKGTMLVRLCLLILLGPALQLLGTSRDVRAVVWDGVPWILAALAGAKLGAAAWTAVRLARARLLGERALAAGAAGWLAAVLVLYRILAWLLDTPHVPHYFLLLLAVQLVPLLRPQAALLALAENRHRGAPPPSSTTARSGRALGVALVLLMLPLAVALALGISFHVRNRNNAVLMSSGTEREYLLYVPKSYDPGRKAPLVISLHGAAMWPAAQMELTRWNAVADENGLIVAYPAGFSYGAPRAWRMGGPGGRADVQFISDLIDRLQAAYNVDPRRIYADGLSNGGGMAFVLSCTLSDRIAAVGMVGSAQLLPWSGCTDPRPVPMIAFHGTEDRFAPYQGGRSFVAPETFPSIPTWAANWARRNRCAAGPEDAVVAADVTRREYTGCADDATVVLYTIQGGGHTWPGGGPLPEWFVGRTSHGVDASREEWAFFRAHPLAGK